MEREPVPGPPRARFPRAALIAAIVLAPALLAFASAVPGGLIHQVREFVLGDGDGEGPPTAAPPSVTITFPADGAGVSRAFTVRGTATDDGPGLQAVQVRVDDGPWMPAKKRTQPVDADAWELPVTLAPGRHVVEARASDGGHWSVTDRVTVKVGAARAPPSVQVKTPEDRAGFRADEGIGLAGTVTASAPVSRVMVSLSGVPLGDAGVVALPAGGATWSFTVPAHRLGPGLHTLAVTAFDQEGGADGTSIPRSVRVAVAEGAPAPMVRVVTPGAGSGHAHDDRGGCEAADPCVRFAGVVHDPGGRADGVLVSVDDGPWRPLETFPGSRFTRAGVTAEWGFDWPTKGAYAGVHVVRARANGSAADAPAAVPFALSAPRALAIAPSLPDVDVLPSVTPLTFTAVWPNGSMPRDVSWTVDGASREADDAGRLAVTFTRPGDHEVAAFARDAAGRAARASLVVTIENRAPEVALDVPETAFTNVTAHFDAAGTTDPEGETLAYRFDFGDGTVTEWDRAPRASHVYRERGTFEARVHVRDASGGEATLARPVRVANAFPEVAFTLTPGVDVTTRTTVTLNATATDADGEITRVRWDLGDGSEPVLNRTGVTHRFTETGRYTIRFTAWDDEDAVARATRTLVVSAVPPRANFTWSPPWPNATEDVLFGDLSVAGNAPIVGWQWDIAGNATTERNPTWAFQERGAYPVLLRVTDALGNVGRALRVVHVGNAPPDVAVQWTPQVPRAFDEVQFQAVATDRDGVINDTLWAFPRNETVKNATNATFTFTRPGTFPVTFTAWDGLNASRSVTVNVTVLNRPPTARVPDPGVLYAGVPVNVTGAAEDRDGRIVNWTWSVRGYASHVAHGPHLEYTFPVPGVYEVALTVRDDAGEEASATRAFAVDAPPSDAYPPRVEVTFPGPGDVVRNRFAFKGTAASVMPIDRVDVQVWRDGEIVPIAGENTLRARGQENWSAAFESTLVPNGDYMLVARVVDTRGAAAVTRVPFIVSNVDDAEMARAVVSVNTPAAGEVVGGSLVVRGSAYHPAGLSHVRARVDDQPWHPVEGGRAEWFFPLDTTRLSNGPHTLTVRAYRDVHAFKDATVDFVVENYAPVLRVTAPIAGNATGIVTVRGVFEGDTRGVIEYRLEHGPWRTGETVDDAWRFTLDTRRIANGNHTLTLRGVAPNGLVSTPVAYAFTVWNAPILDEVVPRDNGVPGARDVPALGPAHVLALLAAACVMVRARRAR